MDAELFERPLGKRIDGFGLDVQLHSDLLLGVIQKQEANFAFPWRQFGFAAPIHIPMQEFQNRLSGLWAQKRSLLQDFLDRPHQLVSRRQASTKRLHQSITATRYRNPHGMGTYVISAHHTWSGPVTSRPASR